MTTTRDAHGRDSGQQDWETRLIDCADGDVLNVACRGLARPRVLVCVPGLGDTWESYKLLADALPSRYGLVLVDPLGHGRSSKHRGRCTPAHQSTAISRALGVLGVRAAAVIGHSYGGVIAQQFADDHPEVPAVVLMATMATMVGHPAAEAFAALGASLPDDVVPDDVVALQGDSFFGPVDDATLAPYIATAKATPGYVWREVIETMLREEPAARMARWRPRALVVAAEEDKVIGAFGSEALARSLPGARLVVIPGTSHAMHWERPELVAAAIDAFLQEVP
jgi:pimeloyl-ACP methyl ester carboxylesterase